MHNNDENPLKFGEMATAVCVSVTGTDRRLYTASVTRFACRRHCCSAHSHSAAGVISLHRRPSSRPYHSLPDTLRGLLYGRHTACDLGTFTARRYDASAIDVGYATTLWPTVCLSVRRSRVSLAHPVFLAHDVLLLSKIVVLVNLTTYNSTTVLHLIAFSSFSSFLPSCTNIGVEWLWVGKGHARSNKTAVV